MNSKLRQLVCDIQWIGCKNWSMYWIKNLKKKSSLFSFTLKQSVCPLQVQGKWVKKKEARIGGCGGDETNIRDEVMTPEAFVNRDKTTKIIVELLDRWERERDVYGWAIGGGKGGWLSYTTSSSTSAAPFLPFRPHKRKTYPKNIFVVELSPPVVTKNCLRFQDLFIFPERVLFQDW